MDSKQFQSLKAHSDQLANFIIRLSSFYEGLSSDIDRELKVLRGHLSGQQNYTLAAVSINKVNQHLMLEQTNVKKFSSQMMKQLESDLKAFHNSPLVSENTANDAGKLAQKLRQPIHSLFEVINLHERVQGLFKKTLQSPADIGSVKNTQTNAVTAPPSQDEKEKATLLRKEIIDELCQLINSYSRLNPNDVYILSVKQRLEKDLSEEELLDSCLSVIRVIVQETLSEANTAGRVIQRLDNALTRIGDNVDQGISTSESVYQARLTRNEEIKTAVNEIGDAVNDSENIEALKERTQHYLSQITHSLSVGEESERSEQEGLMTLLQSMQEQLISLQQQTDSYRKKLVEQRVSMYTDPLTKVPNRMAYNEKARKEWSNCQERKIPLSLALVDVDHFKRINDQYGHAAGDKTLQVIARHIKSHLRLNEFLARWGGEEFILLFPTCTAIDLEDRLNEMRASLAELPFKFKQTPVKITVSIGGTQCIPGELLDNAFERADQQLYNAKEAGRNKVIVYQE